MKVTITFDLPEEREEFHDAINGTRRAILLDDICRAFRDRDKFAEKQETTWAEARALLHETIRDDE